MTFRAFQNENDNLKDIMIKNFQTYVILLVNTYYNKYFKHEYFIWRQDILFFNLCLNQISSA